MAPTARTDLLDDVAVLARVAAGDRDALEVLYRRHAGWLTGRLQARCRDTDVVDLAVQDTFLAVWRSADRYRGDGDVGAWIWGIGIRRLIDQLRRRRSTARRDRSDPSGDELVAAAASAEEIALGAGLAGEARAALDGLEPELRAVLVATAIDGLTTREAGRLLGVPQGTVKTRLQRARRRIQEVPT